MGFSIAVFALSAALSASTAFAQGVGTIKGTVTDPSAASVPNAAVHVTGAGQTRDGKTDGQGQYTVSLPAGQYSVRITAPGFVTATKPNVAVTHRSGESARYRARYCASAAQVDVTASGVGTVSVDPSQNAGAIVLSEADLDALPDDPDDLEAQLTAMAGPAAGPNGAADFYRWLQRRPDAAQKFDSRNPHQFESVRIGIRQPRDSDAFRFSPSRARMLITPAVSSFLATTIWIRATRLSAVPMPHYNNRQYEGSVSGPLGKKLSWFLDLSQRNFNTAQLINGETLGPAPTFRDHSLQFHFRHAFEELVGQSAHRLRDQLEQHAGSALSAQQRVERKRRGRLQSADAGSLMAANKYKTVQATETMVIGTKSVNEILFQFNDSAIRTACGFRFAGPTVNVASAFTSGGNTEANFNRNRATNCRK